MAAKTITVLCASALILQVITAQCLKSPLNTGFPATPILNDLIPLGGACSTGLAANNGGGLTVTSASPMAPIGLVVTSDNAMEGAVAVGGQLPLLGTVTMEAVIPSAGAGAVSYECGDGSLGIVSEGSIDEVPIIAATVPAIVAPVAELTTVAATPALVDIVGNKPAISSPAPAFTSPVLGSSFKFGPGKSPFSSPAPKAPFGRGGCAFRH